MPPSSVFVTSFLIFFVFCFFFAVSFSFFAAKFSYRSIRFSWYQLTSALLSSKTAILSDFQREKLGLLIWNTRDSVRSFKETEARGFNCCFKILFCKKTVSEEDFSINNGVNKQRICYETNVEGVGRIVTATHSSKSLNKNRTELYNVYWEETTNKERQTNYNHDE